MKNLIARLTSPSPTFFKKIRAIGLSLVGIGTALATAPAIPAILVAMSAHLITAGTIATIVAQFTVVDPEVLPKKD